MSAKKPQTNAVERWRVAEAYRQMEVAFITDGKLRSIEYWWQQLAANLITLRQARDYAKTKKWAQRREKQARDIVKGALREHKMRAITVLRQELDQYQALESQMLDMVLAKPDKKGNLRLKIQPSTFEGTVRALVQVASLKASKRDEILTMIEPELAAEAQTGEASPLFSSDEMREVARMLLRGKRAKQQAMAGADDEANDEESED